MSLGQTPIWWRWRDIYICVCVCYIVTYVYMYALKHDKYNDNIEGKSEWMNRYMYLKTLLISSDGDGERERERDMKTLLAFVVPAVPEASRFSVPPQEVLSDCCHGREGRHLASRSETIYSSNWTQLWKVSSGNDWHSELENHHFLWVIFHYFYGHFP